MKILAKLWIFDQLIRFNPKSETDSCQNDCWYCSLLRHFTKTVFYIFKWKISFAYDGYKRNFLYIFNTNDIC